MSVGEAACVSVQGANRLGSNSLLDLVVFEKSAANRCKQIINPKSKNSGINEDSYKNILKRFEKIRNSSGNISVSKIRLKNARNFKQNYLSLCIGLEKLMKEGKKKLNSL